MLYGCYMDVRGIGDVHGCIKGRFRGRYRGSDMEIIDAVIRKSFRRYYCTVFLRVGKDYINSCVYSVYSVHSVYSAYSLYGVYSVYSVYSVYKGKSVYLPLDFYIYIE